MKGKRYGCSGEIIIDVTWCDSDRLFVKEEKRENKFKFNCNKFCYN